MGPVGFGVVAGDGHDDILVLRGLILKRACEEEACLRASQMNVSADVKWEVCVFLLDAADLPPRGPEAARLDLLLLLEDGDGGHGG